MAEDKLQHPTDKSSVATVARAQVAMMPSSGEGKQEHGIDYEVKLTLVLLSSLSGILSSADTRSRAICFAKQPINKSPFTLLCTGNRQR